ncbi:MAG: NfeD family protein [Acidiferrobacterales bacterium]
MCHIILALPILGLPVFWLWPVGVAAPVYAVIVMISIWTYAFVMRAMRRPVETGTEEMLHAKARVIEAKGSKARVRVHSETWNATSPDPLSKGDWVEVDEVDGLTLRVRRFEPG